MNTIENLIIGDTLNRPLRTTKNIKTIEHILENETQLMQILIENKDSLTSAQIDYLRQLIYLEISHFHILLLKNYLFLGQHHYLL